MKPDMPDIEDLDAWCVKANTSQGVSRVAAAVPEATFVYLERDPRSTALSMAKALARGQGNRYNHTTLVKASVDWLCNAARFVKLIDEYPERSVLFRYEDLIRQPIKTLEALYRHLGVAGVDEDVLQAGLDGLFYKRTQGGSEDPVDEEDPKDQATVGLQQQAIDRWRRQLTDDEVRLVSILTFPGAGHFDYTCTGSLCPGDVRWALRRAEGLRFRTRQLLRYVYYRRQLKRSPAPQLLGCC